MSPPPSLATARTDPSWAIAMALTMERPSPQPSSRVGSVRLRVGGTARRAGRRPWAGPRGRCWRPAGWPPPGRISVVTSSSPSGRYSGPRSRPGWPRAVRASAALPRTTAWRQTGLDVQARSSMSWARERRAPAATAARSTGTRRSSPRSPRASVKSASSSRSCCCFGDEDSLEGGPPHIQRRLPDRRARTGPGRAGERAASGAHGRRWRRTVVAPRTTARACPADRRRSRRGPSARRPGPFGASRSSRFELEIARAASDIVRRGRSMRPATNQPIRTEASDRIATATTDRTR